MRLKVTVDDSVEAELLNARLTRIGRTGKDEWFHYLSEPIDTPMGLPLSFEVELSPGGHKLIIRSVRAELLFVLGFDVHHEVRLRLPTDEIITVSLLDK